MKSSVAIILLSFLVGCSGCKPEEQNNCDFDQAAMLTNYADNLIQPAFDELKIGTLLLDASIQLFVTEPNSANLVEVRIAWLAAYKAFQRTSMFAFGPAVINGLSFTERFNTYPTDHTGIESHILAEEVLTGNYSTGQVGFPAIGYMIFGDGQTDQQIADGFSSQVSRQEYLSSLSTELKATANQISEDWANYKSAFVANTGNSDGSSEALLVNGLVSDFEIKKNFGFKIPLGKFNGGVVLPEQCESAFAGVSARLATEQMKASARVFAGASSSGVDGLGLDDHLDCLQYGEENGLFLFQRILAQYDQIEVAVDAIPDPMSQTLLSNKPIVDDAHTLMQEMVPMMKRDMTAALGIQITFQDNDGD